MSTLFRTGAVRSEGYELVAPRVRGLPDAATVHEIHDRYLLEIVEGLGLCPFARRSREQGRVHRPVFGAGGDRPTPEATASVLADLLVTYPDAEIVLMTFVLSPGHAWTAATAFDGFVRAAREAYESLASERFYMVGFHAAAQPSDRPLTPDSLVPLLRRAPDPVIQCVRAEVLDRVRKQAQARAAERIAEELDQLEPEIRAMLAGSVQTDPELSADIARRNFEEVGTGEGRARLEASLQAVFEARDRAYGQ